MLEKIVKCPICGEPYQTYSMSAADQSACPACVAKAKRVLHSKEPIKTLAEVQAELEV